MSDTRSAGDDLNRDFFAGGATETGVVGAFRSKREPMLHAPPRGAPHRRRWVTRLAHVRGQGGAVHGPH